MTEKILQAPQFWLTLADCERLFKDFRELIEFDEPIPPFETRFEGKLESIIGSISQTFSGQYLNPTILDASTAYLNQLIRGHPFRNGNKRMAVLFTHAFLMYNNVDLTLTSTELFTLATLIALAGKFGKSNDETKDMAKEIILKFSKKAKF